MHIAHAGSRKAATLAVAFALSISGFVFSGTASHAESIPTTPAPSETSSDTDETAKEDATAPDTDPGSLESENPASDTDLNAEESIPSVTPTEDTSSELPEISASLPKLATPRPVSPEMTTPLSASSLSASGQAATSLKVTWRSNSKTSVGKSIVVKGKASSLLKKKLVKLQLKSGGKWGTVATSKVKSDGTFRLEAEAKKAGSQKYRVAHNSTPTTKATTTAAFTYSVWKWYNLSDLNLSPVEHAIGPAKIAGKRYMNSVSSYYYEVGVSTSTLRTNKVCTKFRSHVGLESISETNALAHFSLITDRVTTPLATTSRGAADLVTADITGVREIGLRTSGDPYKSSAVFANPKVFCKSKPQ